MCAITLFFSCLHQKQASNVRDTKVKTDRGILLLDFEKDDINNNLIDVEANHKIVDENGNKSLEISFKKDEKNTGVKIVPNKNYQLDKNKKYSLFFDAKSLGNETTFLTVYAENGKGERVRRIVNIDKGDFKSYYFEITPNETDINSGLRDTPKAWNTEANHMKISGLLYNMDFTEVAEINFYRSEGLKDKSILVDNIRIVESPERDPNFLKGIVDKFGQNAKIEFPIKVHSDEELKKIANEELKSLAEYTLMPDRCEYGGWKDGPKLEATGFFRTEKVNGKWGLVCPDGHLYFSIGLANVRMANSTTYTGIDYTDKSLYQRDPEDVTPEDSKGIIDIPLETMKTGYVVNKLRNEMFVELPKLDDPLANHYSYRRESHFGPIKHGQTFSFYRSNLERRYGEQYKNSFFDKWLEVTENRMRNWGFTSFGNWIDPAFYHRNNLPYFANGWIIGDFQKVYSGADYWGPMPDPFDPEFTRRVKKSVDVVAEEVKNNPWCMGVFIDNERSWGHEGSKKAHYGLVLDGLSKGKESFLKQQFITILTTKYTSIENLNTSWKTNFTNWSELEKGANYKNQENFNDGMLADFSILLEAFATKYFETIHDALETKMPNFMYMGCRFANWGITEEVRKAAAKFVDVFSYNYYKEGIGKKSWEFLAEVDMPTIIGEYHIGASDSGLFHPGLVIANDQEDRANMWADYAYSTIDNPYLVGAHWFQYLDSPISGRAHDGENYNVGFVSNTDIPYPQMIKKAKAVNASLYTRRFGKVIKNNMNENH